MAAEDAIDSGPAPGGQLPANGSALADADGIADAGPPAQAATAGTPAAPAATPMAAHLAAGDAGAAPLIGNTTNGRERA